MLTGRSKIEKRELEWVFIVFVCFIKKKKTGSKCKYNITFLDDGQCLFLFF